MVNERDIVRYLKIRREELGLSQEGLSFESGISKVTIARYELAKTEMRLKTFLQVLDALNIEMRLIEKKV